MRFFVNENCIGCGLCESICPEVFEMTGEGVAKATENEVEPDHIDKAGEALNSCPVAAIEEE